MSTGVQELRPPLPAICRWTGRLVCLPFFLLLMVGTLLETVLGQTGFMARPATLLAFGVLMLALGVSVLGWYRTWAESGWRRREARAGRLAPELGWQAPRKWRVHAVATGAFCVINGLALLAGGISQR